MSFFDEEVVTDKVKELQAVFMRLKGRLSIPMTEGGEVPTQAMLNLVMQAIQESLTMQHQNAVIASALTALLEEVSEDRLDKVRVAFIADVDTKVVKLTSMAEQKEVSKSSIIMPQMSGQKPIMRPQGN